MKEFIITEQQALFILKTLEEFPAKHVLKAIDIIRTEITPYIKDENKSSKEKK